MPTRSSLAARNSHVSKGFLPEQPRAKDLSRSALLLGTALGASIAVFAAAAPGTANAQVCTPVVSGGVDTVTCTAGTYPTGITVSDPANPVVVNVPTGATVTGGVFAAGANGTYTAINIGAGSSVSGSTGIYSSNSGGEAFVSNGADVSSTFVGIRADTFDGYGSIVNTGDITISGGPVNGAGIVVAFNDVAYVNNSGDITDTGNASHDLTGVYAGAYVYSHVVNTGNITIDNTGTGTAVGITTVRITGKSDDAYVVAGNVTVTSAGGYAVGVDVNTYDYSGFAGAGAITVSGVTAMGVNLTSNYGNVYGNHTGDITVTGQNGATGMNISGYSLNVTQSGNVYTTTSSGQATALNVTGYTGIVVVNGNVGAYSATGDATGVNAVEKYNSGCCSLSTTDSCIGAVPALYSHFGPGLVTAVYGSVSALAPFGSATGEVLTTGAGEYGYVYVQGDVTAIGGVAATGVSVTSGGSAYVTVGGSVIAIGYFGDAVGVSASAAYGYYAQVHVGGDVIAESYFGNATGVSVYGDSSIYVGGDVIAITSFGNAYGTTIFSSGYAGTTVRGSVIAESEFGNALGVESLAVFGDSDVEVDGDVIAETAFGNAVGVESESLLGYSTVFVGGNVIATSEFGSAIGVDSLSDYTSRVTVDGSVEVEGYTGAIGVHSGAYVLGSAAYANVNGDVIAETVNGNATGVEVYAQGYAYARVGGNVIAESETGAARGVYVYSKDGGSYQAVAEVYGNVTVLGNTSAIGVEAISYGDAKVYVGGNVTVEAINGIAIGVGATGDGFSLATVEGSVTAVGQQAEGAIAEGRYAYVTVGGNIIAVGSSGSAIGAAAISDYQSDVFVGGNVTAISVGGSAYGVLAEALDGNVEVTVQGGVTAESFGGGDAIGVAGIATGDVSIVVYGTTAALGNIADGILAESVGGGSLFIDVGNVTVNQGGGTSSDSGAGIRSYTTGTTHIYADFVYTVGNYTDGIKAGSIGGGGGNTYVDVYGVKTKGAYSTGVDVYGLGNAGVTSTYIKTYGNNSDGIIAVSTAGGVTVNSGEVVTYGENSIGIYAAAGGPVVVNSGFVETFGNFAPGVVAVNLGTTASDTVTVNSGTSITHGAYSAGIYAYGYNGVSVTSQYVKTYGYESPGIVALSYNGPLSVVSNTVHTYYTSSDGIEAESINGSVYVNNTNEVTTDGYFSTGIAASSYFGDVTVISNFVHTYYNSSDGIAATSVFGNVTIDSNTVITDGNYSVGIFGESTYGNVTILSDYVRTSGYSSAGIEGVSFLGNVYIVSGTVITAGDFSPGIVGESIYGSVGVFSQYVKTSGYNSYGILAESYFGDVTVGSGTVKTYGDFSPGIVAESLAGNVSVTSDFVKTTGYDSIGIFAYSRYGNVSVDSGTVITYGDYATGIHAFSYGGTASVSSGYVKTYGYRAEGIYAYGYNGVTVNSGGVKTYGDYSDGIHAISPNGTVNVTSSYVKTEGTGSIGIYAYGWYGATVNSGTVITYGDFAPGIDAIAPYGQANVTSHYVKTYGFESAGIFAYGYYGATVNNTGAVKTYGDYSNGITAEAFDGNVNVTSDEVITHGFDSIGIKAYATYGDVTVNAGFTETYGDNSRGISAVSEFGNVNVTSEDVVTYGFNSNGITAVTDYGGNIYVDSDFVYTYGAYSQGIRAHAHNFGGNVVVYSGEVITEGFDAPGIAALADYGTVLVNSSEVVTHGQYSTGIEAEGYFGTKVYSGSVFTYGNDADAIYARSIFGDTLVATYGTTKTSGLDSSGVVAVSFFGNTNVYNFGTIDAVHGFGIEAVSLSGYVDVYNFGHVFGGYAGVVAESDLGSYIYNKGSIKGGNGFAILAYGAPVFIENKGNIYGYAELLTSNNTLDNHGTWFAYGNSYFGYGNDVVDNHGIIRVAPFSGSATTVFWDGVTVFNNSNLVDLRNGHTGDIFVLNGNGGVGTVWNGLAGSTLGVDAALEVALTSDKMDVGAVTGTTQVVVNDVTPGLPGSLNFVGTTVVHGTSGSASNFTMNTIHKGFIDYELHFFSGPVNWNIVALPGPAAFEMLKAPEMAQDFWRRTGDAWSAREQEIRDSMWGSSPPTRGEGWEMWAQAQIGGERVGTTQTFDVQGFTFTPDLRTSSDWRGFQMGTDNWTSKNWLWGFTGGFLEQNSVFNFDKNSFDITGWNVGAYTGFTSGAFFMNGLIKGDWYDVKANMHTVPALETFSGNTWGLKGEAGFRLGSPHLYLEPLADIYWTTTHLDNANFPAQATTFTFGNATSSRGSIGARIGGQWGSIMPYVGLYAVDAFEGDNKMTMITSGGCPAACMSIEDTKPGTYGKADVGFTTTSWNGLEGFLKGEAEFGSHVDGFTGRLGVRWRW